MSNVKLAIRVRPFTERELRSEKERVPVVNVIDVNTVTITNIKVSASGAGDSRERVRRYFADHTFDSACVVAHPDYASQEKVFETIGREVIASVSRGVSACVLAYGQSATGKTHTMMGSDAQPGLVPRICAALAEEHALDVTVSFLEIYNERVHDLLAGDAPVSCHSLPRRKGNSRKDLRVREHPSRGPYVQNLRRVAVQDLDTLLSLVAEGARRRRTAATRRNTTSSRSHALLELSTPQATLHLADLAGSEKASWEGCGGGRQKEGSNINKSLVALSNVISALVSGGTRGRFVPYRDSALTWLLKDCFTGGASTFIIATISPSVACYGETASTLRWASRARQLPTPRALGGGPSACSRAALQAQLNQLLAELSRHHIRYIPETGKISYEESHWMLNINKRNAKLSEAFNSESNIGNIINMFNPKTEGQNTESTASSVASGSSYVINTVDNNIKDEISKEVDKLFGPALERTRSGSDFEITAPLRHKRRQYMSQEVLPMDKTLQIDNMNSRSSQSQERINYAEAGNVKPAPIPIFYENQRAEIVASVTDRLYSKLKKKEEAAVSKMEAIVDRKIMEPLSELRICTNARQRLVELSQKAIRNKRRIGIPVHTQTRVTVTRVKDQGVDVQTDLDTYTAIKDNLLTLQRDVSTETMPITPRCKEVAVGPYGSLDFCDRSTITDTKEVARKSSFAMTDFIEKFDRCTQTPIVPPPRRRKRSNLSKYIRGRSNGSSKDSTETSIVSPVISINISQQFPVYSESQSSDDNVVNRVQENIPESGLMPPDLLTNHNTVDTNVNKVNEEDKNNGLENIDYAVNKDSLIKENENTTLEKLHVNDNEEFPDLEEYALPRVTVDSSKKVHQREIKNIILGRNESMFPYNIVFSPPRERDNTKRMVKFKEVNADPQSDETLTNWEWENSLKSVSSDITYSEKESDVFQGSQLNTCSDSTDSSKVESNSFIWKGCTGRNHYNTGTARPVKSYEPIYKGNSRYNSVKSRIYREFLGLQNVHNGDDDNKYHTRYSSDVNSKGSSDSTENEIYQSRFKQRKQFFEDKFRSNYDSRNNYDELERKVLDACKSLDRSVNKYESYLTSCPDYGRKVVCSAAPVRTPTEYLQYLVKIRREFIKANCDTSE